MVESTFSAAHQLTKSKTKCEELHGHNWRIQLFIEGEISSEIGWVADFSEIKKALKETLSQLDHTFLNDIFADSPTAERIAKYIYDDVSKTIPLISKISVWEAVNSCASYIPNK